MDISPPKKQATTPLQKAPSNPELGSIPERRRP